MIAPVVGFGQNLVDIHYFTIENFGYSHPNDFEWNPTFIKTERGDLHQNDPYDTRVQKLTVPDGRYWKIVHIDYFSESTNSPDYFRHSIYPNPVEINLIIYNDFFDPLKNSSKNIQEGSSTYLANTSYNTSNPYFLTSGTTFTVGVQFASIVVYEYTIDSINSLSYNYPETNQNNSKTPVLFPNPTSSLLSLNSDKEYDIEVYDMAGNKVMALTGNNINMAHLSTATYIVKATDKSNNEELTYKVVKN